MDSSMMKIWEMSNYSSPINFLTSSFIREYDLSKANISSLLYKGVITEEEYKKYYSMDKQHREIAIGLLELKNPRISTIKKEGITEARKLLFESNNIANHEVLEIRNDAVFVINRDLEHMKFDIFDFKLKNLYQSYAFINKQLSIYYAFDSIHGVDMIDIKGIKDEKLEIFRSNFIQFLCDVFYKLQCETIESTLEFITDFYQRYVKLELPKEFYREFNSFQSYKICSNNVGFEYGMNDIREEDKKYLKIDYNQYIIRVLFKYISELYFSKIKRR